LKILAVLMTPFDQTEDVAQMERAKSITPKVRRSVHLSLIWDVGWPEENGCDARRQKGQPSHSRTTHLGYAEKPTLEEKTGHPAKSPISTLPRLTNNRLS